MEREFVPSEQALALKELGFDEPCFGNWQDMKEETPWFSKSYADNQNQYYGQLCSAPTFSQAFRFFREKYGYYSSCGRTWDNKWFIDILIIGVHKPKYTVFSETYEEAELHCLEQLIEIVESKSE